MDDLRRLREEIDDIDKKIVDLLERRMEVSRLVGTYKDMNGLPILDQKREEEIIQSRVAMLNNKHFSDSVKEIYELVMQCSRQYQKKELEK
jgi:monofunctional chorismate mutase